MDGWRDRSSFDDLVQSERAPARFTNLQKFSSDSNALAFQGPRYDLHFFLFFYSNYGSGEQLAVVFCRNCDWYIAARLFRCRLPLQTDRGNERFRRPTKFSANISRLFFEQQRV